MYDAMTQWPVRPSALFGKVNNVSFSLALSMTDGTRHIIAIPELLRNVLFSLPTRRSTYPAALVCRTWSEIALDVLWYEVDDICVLFNLLVPLTTSTEDKESGQVS